MEDTDKKNNKGQFSRIGVQTEKMLDVVVDSTRKICTEVMAISESEVLLKSDESLPIGTKVSLLLSASSQVSGEVGSSKKSDEPGMFEVTVAYKKMENFINVFSEYIDFSGIRKHERANPKKSMNLEIWDATGKTSNINLALLIDLSGGGLKIKTLKALSSGNFIKIKFQNNSVRIGEVRWCYKKNETYKPKAGEAGTLIFYYAGIMFVTETDLPSSV
jgi:hypothetical protein